MHDVVSACLCRATESARICYIWLLSTQILSPSSSQRKDQDRADVPHFGYSGTAVRLSVQTAVQMRSQRLRPGLLREGKCACPQSKHPFEGGLEGEGGRGSGKGWEARRHDVPLALKVCHQRARIMAVRGTP